MATEPDLRILQANERTLLAWIRTGLTMIALGFVFARLSTWLKIEHPERSGIASSWLGIAAVALGTFCHVLGAVRFVRARAAIVEGRPMVPSASGPVAVAAVVSVLGAGAIVYLTAVA